LTHAEKTRPQIHALLSANSNGYAFPRLLSIINELSRDDVHAFSNIAREFPDKTELVTPLGDFYLRTLVQAIEILERTSVANFTRVREWVTTLIEERVSSYDESAIPCDVLTPKLRELILAWEVGIHLRDTKHELALLAVRKGLAAVAGSDPNMRKKIADVLLDSSDITLPDGSAVFSIIPERTTSSAFLRGQAKQTWMQGIHPPIPTKATSKTMVGPDLREAIDPFGDQTFRLRAALSDVETNRIMADFRGRLPAKSPLRDLEPDDAVGPPFKLRRGALVGISPREGIIWSGSSKSIGDFLHQLDRFYHLIEKARADIDPVGVGYDQIGYRVLVQPQLGVTVDHLKRAIGFELTLPLPAEQPERFKGDPEIERGFLEWWDHGELQLRNSDDGRIYLDAIFAGETIADIRLMPIMKLDGKVELGCTANLNDAHRERFGTTLDHVMEFIKERATIWFDSGFTIQEGLVFSAQFRDVPFERWSWAPFKSNLFEYDLTEEKPYKISGEKKEYIKLVSHNWEGLSLFDYVVRNATNLFPAPHECYLLCDDRSGEIADFIYINPAGELKLMHIKKASSSTNRSLAEDKYGQVVDQATKNLRFLDTDILMNKFRLDHGRPVEKASWAVGTKVKQLPNRDRALAALASIGPHPSREVIILQPHTRRRVLNKAEADLKTNQISDTDRFQLLRLRTKLSNLETVCKSRAASFRVIADNDIEGSNGDKGALFARQKLR